jgi:DNA-binding XRE family transcriptional regulator
MSKAKTRETIGCHDVRMARAALRMTVRELASVAHVAPNTITRIETGHVAIVSTLMALKKAFEDRGISFLADGSVLLSKEAAKIRPAQKPKDD